MRCVYYVVVIVALVYQIHIGIWYRMDNSIDNIIYINSNRREADISATVMRWLSAVVLLLELKASIFERKIE